MRKLFFLISVFALTLNLQAQELNCRVEVIHDRIQNVDPKVFQSLQLALNEFMTNRKWTNDQYKQIEKIDCSFLLNLTARSGSDNVYRANLNIQASRPVFNSTYNTSLVNFLDREIIFRYEESQTLQYDDNRITGSDAMVSNLTAIFAYYAYLIIGLDYDSFSPKGGEEFLKKAQYIVNNAPEEGSNIKGWKPSEGNRNRYWLIEQLLNPRFKDFRPYWYTYHRRGLDMMGEQPEEGRKNILEGVPVLTKINNENPTSYLLQFFFNAKSGEFVNILAQTPKEQRKDYPEQLSKMDVPNTPKYRAIK